MKKLILILFSALTLLLPAACIKDDISNCAGLLHLYFSYIYRDANEFYGTVSTDVHVNYYHLRTGERYRESLVPRNTIDIDVPHLWEKTPLDRDSVTLVAWTHQEQLEYVEPEGTPVGQGYVHLKENTEGSGICYPVEDLLYGTISFDAKERTNRNDVTLPFVRAVCRVRITMLPETVQGSEEEVKPGEEDKPGQEDNPAQGEDTPGQGGTRAPRDLRTPQHPAPDTRAPLIPHAEDYLFHLLGTRNKIDYNNITFGDPITLALKAHYEENTGNVTTNWFGAFSSLDEYIKVNVYIRDELVASFDCAPIRLTSTPGDFIDLIIDGHYVSPRMDIKVNGWKIATVESSM